MKIIVRRDRDRIWHSSIEVEGPDDRHIAEETGLDLAKLKEREGPGPLDTVLSLVAELDAGRNRVRQAGQPKEDGMEVSLEELNTYSDCPLGDGKNHEDPRDIASALRDWLKCEHHSIDEVARIVPQGPGPFLEVDDDDLGEDTVLRVLWHNGRGDVVYVMECQADRNIVAIPRTEHHRVS